MITLQAQSRDAVRIAETRGRIAMGTTILVVSVFICMTGNITGGYHPDKNIRQIQQSQGFVPYSLKIPGTDTYIQYGRLDPIGMLIGVVADFSQIYSDLDEKREKVENNLLAHCKTAGRRTDEQLGFTDKMQNFATALVINQSLKILHQRLILEV